MHGRFFFFFKTTMDAAFLQFKYLQLERKCISIVLSVTGYAGNKIAVEVQMPLKENFKNV